MSGDEVLGRNCRFLQGPDTDCEAVRRIAEALAARRHVHEEIYNYRKDGRGLWFSLDISPVFDQDGTLRFFFASQIDITRRRDVELVQTKHIESIGALTSGVAHEFNNLMTVVAGSTEQALKQAVDARQRQRLERAAWAAQRAGEQASHLLRLARRQGGAVGLLDLNQIVRKLQGLMLQIAGPKVQVVFDLTTAPAVARLDAGQLEHVLLHLVSNATEAMPDGGTATIATSASGVPGGSGNVQVSVSDTGSGMPPEVAERATEAFFTTKDQHTAAGLGLFVALGFAEQAGGTLLVDTKPGHGTTVRLVVPGCDSTEGP